MIRYWPIALYCLLLEPIDITTSESLDPFVVLVGAKAVVQRKVRGQAVGVLSFLWRRRPPLGGLAGTPRGETKRARLCCCSAGATKAGTCCIVLYCTSYCIVFIVLCCIVLHCIVVQSLTAAVRKTCKKLRVVSMATIILAGIVRSINTCSRSPRWRSVQSAMSAQRSCFLHNAVRHRPALSTLVADPMMRGCCRQVCENNEHAARELWYLSWHETLSQATKHTEDRCVPWFKCIQQHMETPVLWNRESLCFSGSRTILTVSFTWCHNFNGFNCYKNIPGTSYNLITLLCLERLSLSG